jgi:hypothetical protein
MTVLSGQTENAGHFLQLAAMAMGHKVIALLLLSPFEHRTERDIALERHCKSLSQSLTSDHAVCQFRRLLSVVVKCPGNDGLRRSTQQPALQLHDAGIKHAFFFHAGDHPFDSNPCRNDVAPCSRMNHSLGI